MTEQRFTDKDKERLKRYFEGNQPIPVDLVQALLARLEAGEIALEKHITAGHDCPELEAWRKVSGK